MGMLTYSVDRIQYLSDIIIFAKTKELYGGLSNMAAGYPILVNGISFRTSEALYQACRFPEHPEIWLEIIASPSPIGAKLISRHNIDKTRLDWKTIKIDVMRWCLWMKYDCNREKFTELLRLTKQKPIVEFSKIDKFWGMIYVSPSFFVGANVLGKLLVELRTQVDLGQFLPITSFDSGFILAEKVIDEKLLV